MEERAWRSVRGGACVEERMWRRHTSGGGTRGEVLPVVELCWGCHVGMFLPWVSTQVSLATAVPILLSLILGVACPCMAFLPGTPKSVHLSALSETCLDGENQI